MLATKVKLTQGGRLVVPADIRKALCVEVGDELLMKVADQELKIYKLHHAVKEAQALMAKYNSNKQRLSDEIIKDRRNET